MKAIVVHGGCDERPVPEDIQARRSLGVERACRAGFEALEGGGSALDAVEAAVHILEDDPVFDAGTGSFMNLLGGIEMDALVASSDGRAGGVAGIERVRYPISIAREVMERTPHILLVGTGATVFARAVGAADYDPATEEARALHESEGEQLGGSLRDLLPLYARLREGLKWTSTVGAVAVDDDGLVVAGTSTGGIPQKLPGRVGDSAILGAGTFASAAGGSSATGMGEEILRLGATRALLERVAAGADAEEATRSLTERFTKLHSPFGIVLLRPDGEAASSHNGYFMPVSYQRDGFGEPIAIGETVGTGAYRDRDHAG